MRASRRRATTGPPPRKGRPRRGGEDDRDDQRGGCASNRFCCGRSAAPWPRRHCLPRRWVIVRVPRLLPVDEPGQEVQLSRRWPSDRCGPPLLQQALPVHPRGRCGRAPHSPCDHLRQVGALLPQRALRGLQGEPIRPAGRPHPAVPVDARGRRGVRAAPGREAGVRGRRHHRDLRARGRRGGRRRRHRLGRQGPDAARRRAGVDVRPGVGGGPPARLGQDRGSGPNGASASTRSWSISACPPSEWSTCRR